MGGHGRKFVETVLRRRTPPAPPVDMPARRDPRADGRDLPREVGGYDGPEPTRFGDWEHNGRCTDF